MQKLDISQIFFQTVMQVSFQRGSVIQHHL